MKRYVALHEIEKELNGIMAKLEITMGRLAQLSQSAGISHNPVEDILFQDRVGSAYAKSRDAMMVASGAIDIIPKLSKSINDDGGDHDDKRFTYKI